MKVISAREFRTQQGKYFDLITTGEDVIVKSREYGSFKITPITENDFILSREQKKILDEQKHLTDSDYQASDEFLTELKKEYDL